MNIYERQDANLALHEFTDVLCAGLPFPALSEKLSLYGQFIGKWKMDAVIYDASGNKTHTGKGSIYFNWILEGKAIQDVWILPDVFYGTTLRIYDPAIDAWHILWIDPGKQSYPNQIGRAIENNIVQVGKDSKGDILRWSFTEITHNSFHWLGEKSEDNGDTFQLQVEFFAKRQ